MNTPTPSSSAVPDAAAISDQLSRDLAACDALLQLMAAEREALEARDADRLGALIEEKAAHLMHLEKSAAIRTHWARQVQAASPESGWQQLLEDLQQAELNEQWERLKERMAACRDENEVNGRMLARSQQTFGRLLNIVRGQAEAPALYNQKGNRSGGGSSHNFGEA